MNFFVRGGGTIHAYFWEFFYFWEFVAQFVADFEEDSIQEEEHERDDMTFFYSPHGTSHPTRLYNDQVMCVCVCVCVCIHQHM